MEKTHDTFVVDRRGLARKLEHRPKSFIIHELVQNAWDEAPASVRISARMKPGQAVCEIVVEDDSPDGFQDLASVYTLFRDSKKAPDPTKRGRFEMGEKLVIALALRAEISSTKGTIVFEGETRQHSKHRQVSGTVFRGDFRMTRKEFEEVERSVHMLLVPDGIDTYYNGARLEPRRPLHTFETTLQTVKSDTEGVLTTTSRKTKVAVYERRQGELAHIYEMGIPVVPTGDLWHYDVDQRVPVNWERNNVPPSYLKTLRVEVLNALHGEVKGEEMATAQWVSDAADDPRCSAPAIKQVVTERFGEKAVIYDPSDTEGTKIAITEGYNVVTGGAFSKGAWNNIKNSGALLPAGQVTPSPRPYDPEGHPENVIPEAEWSEHMRRRALFAQSLFERLVPGDGRCYVVIVNEPHVGWSANFGELLGTFRLCLNLGKLGKVWFAMPHRAEPVLDLLLHEFCHHQVRDHLSHEMHKMATELGARLANIALDSPELFDV